MITTLANPWLAQNAGRKFPLADDVDTIVPNAALLDFRCTVRGLRAGETPVAWLTDIAKDDDAGTVLVTVWVKSGTRGVDVLLFEIPDNIARHEPHTVYVATDRSAAALTVTAEILTVEVGSTPVRFAPATVVADGLKVDSVNGEDTANPPATGEIVLEPGYNAEPYLDGNRIRLDIYKGAGLGENCQTPAASQHCGNVLFSVNGERPGSDGNLKLVGEDGITVTSDKEHHAVEIRLDATAKDKVSKTCEPACG